MPASPGDGSRALGRLRTDSRALTTSVGARSAWREEPSGQRVVGELTVRSLAPGMGRTAASSGEQRGSLCRALLLRRVGVYKSDRLPVSSHPRLHTHPRLLSPLGSE